MLPYPAFIADEACGRRWVSKDPHLGLSYVPSVTSTPEADKVGKPGVARTYSVLRKHL